MRAVRHQCGNGRGWPDEHLMRVFRRAARIRRANHMVVLSFRKAPQVRGRHELSSMRRELVHAKLLSERQSHAKPVGAVSDDAQLAVDRSSVIDLMS
jgi:hypothetical protein